MSYTGMRAAFEDGIMGEAAEFQNAWRGAMFIWIYMCRKYLNLQYMPMSEAECEKVWALAKDPRVSRQDRLAFMSTFDNILLGPDLMLEVADALDSIPEATDNVRSQAIWIRKMHARGARAIGWRQTSVIAPRDPAQDREGPAGGHAQARAHPPRGPGHHQGHPPLGHRRRAAAGVRRGGFTHPAGHGDQGIPRPSGQGVACRSTR